MLEKAEKQSLWTRRVNEKFHVTAGPRVQKRGGKTNPQTREGNERNGFWRRRGGPGCIERGGVLMHSACGTQNLVRKR